MNRATAVSVVVALAVVVGAELAVHFLHRKESTPALRGAAVALQQGCLSCHGPAGRGGVADPGSRNGFVPGWDGPTVATLVENESELREWIMQGEPARLSKMGEVARRTPLVPMPAYGKRITDQEFSDLLVYFRAVSNFGTEMPEPVYEGWKTADRLGCFGCHGPGGIGGAQNPGSLKGHIPAWDGAEFAQLVRDDAELSEWIMNGYPKRLWDNPAARYFIDGQAIGMPAYRKHLSVDAQARLIAYFQWLRKKPGTQAKKDDTHHIMGLIPISGATP